MSTRSQSLAWALMSPTLVILIGVGFVPFLYVFQLSFYHWYVFSAVGKVWAGLDPYRQLVTDPAFLHSMGVTLEFVVITTAIQLPLGFFFATLLNQEFKFKNAFRTVFTLPLTIAPIVIGSIWLLMARPGVGPLPVVMEELFGITYNIGRSQWQAFATVVAMDIWHWTPFVTLTFLAGLASLPRAPYEAAQIDGVPPWAVLFRITLPMLKPVIITILFIRVMDAFKIYDEVWMLTSGGPDRATRTVSIHLVRMVNASSNYGYAATVSVFVLYLVIIICWLSLIFIRGGAEEG